MEKEIIVGYLLEYLKKREVKIKVAGACTMLECPYCHKVPMSATIPPRCTFINCFSCNAKKKNIIDIVRDTEKVEGTDDDVIHYIKELLNLDMVTKKDTEKINEVLKFYVENGFDLVPVAKDKKIPVEQDWTHKIHKDIDEWQTWLGDGINLGIKTGKSSNLTILDVDVKPVPKEILALVGDTFTLETSKGFQYYYKYIAELPKTRINDLKIDLENEGGQCVAFPSIVDGVKRKINSFKPIIEMPKDLLDYLKTKVTVPLKSFSEKLKEDIQTENFNLNLLNEGERNVSLLKLGGLLRKELNVNQTERVLSILNRHICTNPISSKDLNAMVKSLSRYTDFDEKELAHRVMIYLKDVEEAGRMEICSAIMGTNRGEEKIRIDKVLNYLVKEGYIQKKGSRYILLQKMTWANSLLDTDNNIGFKIPYFYDIANIEYGDLILIGGTPKLGKTHISMNIIKQLVEQGIKPYYISLESGSRFKKIALQLGLKDDDFNYNKKWIDPVGIQLESKAIMIIDWLCPDNFAEVDKIFRHFTEQLAKTGGILIVFMQLKGDGNWFSSNLVMQFPALCVKYIYDDEKDGTYGKFVINAVRDPKSHIKTWEIACKYDWQTKLFLRIDELEKKEIKEQGSTKELPKDGEIQIDTQEISN
jgi:archaellum biogenesis ATPase FlaH